MATNANASASVDALEFLIWDLRGPLFDGWTDGQVDRFRAIARFQFSEGPGSFEPLVKLARELLPRAMPPAAVPFIVNDEMLSPNTRFPELNRAALSFVTAYLLVLFEPAIREWEAAERAA